MELHQVKCSTRMQEFQDNRKSPPRKRDPGRWRKKQAMAAVVLGTCGQGDGLIQRGPTGIRRSWPRRIHFWQRGGFGWHERGDRGGHGSTWYRERESCVRERENEREREIADGRRRVGHGPGPGGPPRGLTTARRGVAGGGC